MCLMAIELAMKTHAVAYLRTSSFANVAGDSAVRQRHAIQEYARHAGLEVMEEFVDPGVSGADHLNERAGFVALMAYVAATDCRTVIVENASRFARDLIVQETGFAMLGKLGVVLIAADDPNAFAGDTPTANMVRQILGAVSEFEKANLVAKLRGARDRASATAGRRIEGRKSYDETNPDLIRQARRLARRNPKTGVARSLRTISAELAKLGFTSSVGKEFTAAQVSRWTAKRT